MLESQNIKNIIQDIGKNEKNIVANEIGNKLTDFEILQVLGQGAFGFVAKVRSKKNLKIYAMKKVDISKVVEDEKKYYENEHIFLEKLDHPNVCKLFSSFREGSINYMILEFLDNGDLWSFLNAHIKLKKYIPEEKLWNIFEQCLNGLVYIHSMGVINRDIKPTNILYGSNGECKITDFNISSFTNMEKAAKFTNDEKKKQEMINQCTDLGSGMFKAPEVLNFDYDEKADVYSLGMAFCSMAYQQMAIPNDEPRLYSKELADIISLMITDQQYRPTSKKMYNYFIRLYVEKYLHMTSLVSCINCLSCYISLRNFFKSNDSYIESKKFNEKEKKITKQFNRILKALDEKKNSNLKSSILTQPGGEGFNYLLFKLRESLFYYGIERKDDNAAEIEPIYLINFILNKLHGELNTKIVNKGIKKCLKLYVQIPNNVKQQAYDNYMIFYNSNYKSNISDNFFGMIKTKKICLNCNQFSYSFNMFSYLPFKVEIMVKAYQGKKNDLNIYDAFDCLNKNFVFLDIKKCVKCRNCNTYTDHNELKQFFNLPKNLIIIFDRGQNYEHKEFIDFPDILILNGNHVECFMNKIDKNYELLGIICRVEAEHQKIKFVSFTKSNNNNYINFEDKKQYNLENIKTFGDIIGLFYYCSYVEENPMDDIVINYLKNNSNNDNNLNNNFINNVNINQNNNINYMNNCGNNIMQNNNNCTNNNNGNNGYCPNNNIPQFSPSNNCNNNNINGHYQINNFNNNSNNSNNNGYCPNNNFGPINNFNNNSNNSNNNNGNCQNINFNQYGPNNNCNNNNNGYCQNINFSQLGPNNNFNNNSNNSNNNGYCPNNNFNNGNNGFNQNNNIQNNNNQNNFNNTCNQNMMMNSNQNMMMNSNQNMMMNSNQNMMMNSNQNMMLNSNQNMMMNSNQNMMLNSGNQF